MKASERIAAQIAPTVPSLAAPGYKLDTTLLITILLAVARVVLEWWLRRDPNAVKRRLDRALDPRWYDLGGQLWRRSIAGAVRDYMPNASERDIDAVIKGLADQRDADLLSLLAEASS